MADAEKELDIIVKAVAQNTAALQEVSTSVDHLNTSVTASATAHEKHATAGKKAAEAERDLTKEGGEAARAMSSLGAAGSEVFDRFSALSGMMGSGGELGIALGATLVGVGALIEGSKKISETYDEQVASIDGLKQATDATHRSFEDLNKTFEDWVAQNQEFIPNINTARDELAAFTRAGFDANEAMQAENATIDLAALKHEDLATAGNQVLQMMEGQGRVAKQLGIDIAALKNSDDNAVKAHKDWEKATTDVAKAQDTLSKALRSQKEEEDALSGKRKLSQHDLDVEQDKANAVKKAQDDLTKALQDQKTAQDNANTSMQQSQQILDQVSVKVDKGRQNLTDLQKQQNANAAAWDDFVSRSGPAVNYMFLVIEGTINGLIQLLNDAAQGIQWIAQHAGSALPGGGTSQVQAGRTAQYQPYAGGQSGTPVQAGGGGGGSVGSDVLAPGMNVTFNISHPDAQWIANAVDARLARLLTST